MAEVKKGDFVQVQYTGKLEDGTAFDTTSKKEAEKQGLSEDYSNYGPVTICIGEGHVVPGLDKQLEGKKVEEVYNLEVPAEDGFGKKDAKQIQMIATNKFTKEGITPAPGLQVNIDGMMGIVKSVSGGRTLVDFNHPLSGQKLLYEIKIDRIIDDDTEKVKALLKLKLGIEDADVHIKDGKATISTSKDLGMPEEFTRSISDEVSKLVPSVKEMEFAAKDKDSKTAESAAKQPQEQDK
ncbi:peptidylprolyl isomerase [Candidatus Woesearchaeota archaeon]|nr:peptidylprolyl isomerase [Candidatus Woesearchaeota archaeon]